MSEPHIEYEHRVTPLELFFDLVFVFAFTQVTTLLSNQHSPSPRHSATTEFSSAPPSSSSP